MVCILDVWSFLLLPFSPLDFFVFRCLSFYSISLKKNKENVAVRKGGRPDGYFLPLPNSFSSLVGFLPYGRWLLKTLG